MCAEVLSNKDFLFLQTISGTGIYTGLVSAHRNLQKG